MNLKTNFYKNHRYLRKIFGLVKYKEYFCNKFMLEFIK